MENLTAIGSDSTRPLRASISDSETWVRAVDGRLSVGGVTSANSVRPGVWRAVIGFADPDSRDGVDTPADEMEHDSEIIRHVVR